MDWFDKLFDAIGAFCAIYLVVFCISLVVIELISIFF